jgi:hypothetical protein
MVLIGTAEQAVQGYTKQHRNHQDNEGKHFIGHEGSGERGKEGEDVGWSLWHAQGFPQGNPADFCKNCQGMSSEQGITSRTSVGFILSLLRPQPHLVPAFGTFLLMFISLKPLTPALSRQPSPRLWPASREREDDGA